jgi:hypothetical protein
LAGKVVELLDVQSLNSQLVLNKYHFWNEDGLADVADLRGLWKSDILPTTQSFQSGYLFHVGVNTRVVAPTPLLVQEETVVPAISGLLGGETLPGSVTYSIKWFLAGTTDVNGGGVGFHIKRGGKHLPGPTAGAQGDSGVYDGSQDAHIQTFIAALLGLSSSNWQLCVFTPAETVPVARVAAISLVTGGTVKGFGTQVTRKIGRGA